MSQGGDPRQTLGVVLASTLLLAVLGSACVTRPHPASPAPDGRAGTRAPGAEDVAADPEASDASDPEAPGDTRGLDEVGESSAAGAGPCPADMVLIEVSSPAPRRFCVDRYEASLVELLPDGSEKPFTHYTPVDGHNVRAVSIPHAFPQGFISEVQAQDACGASGKRLCNLDEWKVACMGPSRTAFPYGEARRPGACHDTGKSAVTAVFGAKAVAASPVAVRRVAPPTSPTPTAAVHASAKRAHVTKGRAAHVTKARAPSAKVSARTGVAAKSSRGAAGGGHDKTSVAASGVKKRGRPAKSSVRPASVDAGVWSRLNDPALGQVEGALARTGDHGECVNGFGVFDMVGNLHEWVAADSEHAAHGTFAGGYYLDTTINGEGCSYKTQAHAHDYHDYSTGFRCCAEAAPPAAPPAVASP